MEYTIKKKIMNSLCSGNLDLANKLIKAYQPLYLYKYRSGADYDLDALKKGMIWIARASTMDDDDDCRVYLDNNFKKEFEKAKKENLKFNNCNYDYVVNNIDKITKHDSFLCSFSEICDNEDMWERYANKKSGFCIEYNFSDLFENQKVYPLVCFPVVYGRKPKLGIKDCSSVQRMVFRTGFYKRFTGDNGENWKEQEEWRYFCFEKSLGELDKQDGKLVPAPVPTKIIIGENASKELKKEIEKLVIGHNETIDLEFR